MTARIRSLVYMTAAIGAVSLAAPVASALATDRYVDDQGSGLPPCTVQTNPCANLTAAVIASSSGDVVHVGGTATQYAGNITLPNGVSLIRDAFTSGAGITTTGTATINTTGSATPAITVAAGSGLATVSAFTLRGGNLGGSAAMIVSDNTSNLTISGNTFDDHSINVPQQLRFNGGGTFHVNGNSFIGANDGVIRRGMSYSADEGGTVEIGHNSMSDLFYPIQLTGPTPPVTVVNVHDNTITDVYDDPGPAIPVGISVNGATGTMTDNFVTQIPGQSIGNGFDVGTGTPATGIPLQVARNQVYGFVDDSRFGGADPVVLTDDVFANDGAALALFGPGDVTASGITATGSTGGFGYEILLSDAHLALDSSFVGPAGVKVFGTSTCVSSFSATTGAPGDCGLAPVADPMFVNPAADNFHLLSGSPLIDTGNPAPPAATEFDFEGDPRAVMAIASCTPRRDIGADEFTPASPVMPLNCTPPNALDTSPPDTSVSGKKKVKTRKKKARVTFTFTSTKAGSTFACSLDGRPFSPCSSPFSAKLRRGAHTLSVRATDAGGNADPSPGTFTTRVKRKR